MTDENAEIRATVEAAQNTGQFVFIPSPPIPSFKALFVPVLATTRLKPDDFYPVAGGGSYGIHHAAAMRLANQAGIDWVSDLGRVGRMDNTQNPDYCLFRATGRIRGLDGLYQELSASKQLNVAEKRKAMIEKYRTQFHYKTEDFKRGQDNWGNKVTKGPWPNNKEEYAKVNADKECNHLRETMVERCESGSQVRVIRAILGLPASFKVINRKQKTHAGLKMEFFIVRYILDPSRSDVQTIQLQALAQAHAGVYGTTPAIEGPPMPATLPMKDVTPENERIPETTGKTINVPTSNQDTSVLDFENTPPEEQERTILAMIEQKNYAHYNNDMNGQPGLALWNQEARTEYFTHIRNQKGAAA